MKQETTDIIIIGAGPSGSVAASLLCRAGRQVTILEKETFPRFSIGESLLPQSMGFIENAGLLRDVVEAGFQHKNGAAFAHNGKRMAIDFRRKVSAGWGTTYQVPRADFDKVLADGAVRHGADIRYRHCVTAVDIEGDAPVLTVTDEQGNPYMLRGTFLLDASGFGRVLPRLLDLDMPSTLPTRHALFTHIEDNIDKTSGFDRNKILITVHPEQPDIWYWLIPFSNGRCSIGVVARRDQITFPEGDARDFLRSVVHQDPGLAQLLRGAVWDTPTRQIRGYSADVKALSGQHFALLGNAGEFLDPVFSSGVTIAFKSSELAAQTLLRQLRGEAVDWARDYDQPLKKGVDTFRAFVDAWYDGRLQTIIFHEDKNDKITQMIAAVLAGYAWDESNPFVARAAQRLASLEAACALV